ncbi:MAG: dipeptidase [Acidobacteria bacterium]|nr:dipeptidase [Acidobacteriota bacterium]
MPTKFVALCSLVILPIALVAFQQAAEKPDPLVAKAMAIHKDAITLDTHVDIGGADYATPALDPGAPTSRLKCDLTKMEKGGLKGVFLAVYVGQGPLDAAGYARAHEQAMVKFAALKRLTEQMYPNRCAFATSPADVERIAKTGKRVIMTGVENGYPMGMDLANVKKFYDLGARYITLSHSGNNQLADSSGSREPLHNGLSALGRQVVAEMNRLGMMIDVSHIAEKSFWDVIALTKAPIIASHSGSKALADVDRNLTDDQLKALTKNGGVIQTVALASFLKMDDPARTAAIAKLREEIGLPARGGRGAGGGRGGAGAAAGAAAEVVGRRAAAAPMTDEQRAEYEKKMALLEERMKDVDAKFPPASLKDFVDHIDHAVKVAGIDHVGIGTDFDGGGGIAGFNDDTDAPNVTIELVRRGYTEEQIKKIWGGNLLRVWRDVENVAAKLQKTR